MTTARKRRPTCESYEYVQGIVGNHCFASRQRPFESLQAFQSFLSGLKVVKTYHVCQSFLSFLSVSHSLSFSIDLVSVEVL